MQGGALPRLLKAPAEPSGDMILTTLRCAQPECRQNIAQVHFMCTGIFRVLKCPKCGGGSEYMSTPYGIAKRPIEVEKE